MARVLVGIGVVLNLALCQGPFARAGLLIVIPARNDGDVCVFHRVHQAVHLVDTTRPKPTQVAQQRLRFADALEWVTPGCINQGVDALQGFFVLSVPILVIGPSRRGKGHAPAHSVPKVRGRALPALYCAIDSAKWAALAGLDKRCRVSAML